MITFTLLSICQLGLYLILWQEAASAEDASLVGLILRASPVARLILLILLGMSIASWAIIFTKWKATKRTRELSALFIEVFDKSRNWADLTVNTSSLLDNPIKSIFKAAQTELQKQNHFNSEAIQRVMQSAVIDETTRLERNLGLLASTASASPFIGLFGTVVGIIIAFQGLTQSSTASIQAVAPGIAEALVATAAGIGAAIPAVLAYNHYVHVIKVISSEMDSFSLRLLNMIEREARSS